MKLILLFLCLFGIVFCLQDASREQWITSAVNSLNSDLVNLNSTDRYPHPIYDNFRGLIEELKPDLISIRTKLEKFPVNGIKSNSIHPSDKSDELHLEHEFYMLQVEFGFVRHKFNQVFKTIDREQLKLFGLCVAAYQYKSNYTNLPAPSQLISDIKAIIAKEQTRNQFVRMTDDSYIFQSYEFESLRQELDNLYQKLNNTLENSNANNVVSEQRIRLRTVFKKADQIIAALRSENNALATKKADMLQNGKKLVIDTLFEIFKLLPIDDWFRAEQLVDIRLREHSLRSLSSLESMMDLIDASTKPESIEP